MSLNSNTNITVFSNIVINIYLLIFPISHKTRAIIRTTTITPTHIPVLKISPTAAHPESKKEPAKKNIIRVRLFLIVFILIVEKTISLKNFLNLPFFRAHHAESP